MAGANEFVLIAYPTNRATQVWTDRRQDTELPIFGWQHINCGLRRSCLPGISPLHSDGLCGWLGERGQFLHRPYVRPVDLCCAPTQRIRGKTYKWNCQQCTDCCRTHGKQRAQKGPPPRRFDLESVISLRCEFHSPTP